MKAERKPDALLSANAEPKIVGSDQTGMTNSMELMGKTF